jgi:hypothetical protein
MSKSS